MSERRLRSGVSLSGRERVFLVLLVLAAWGLRLRRLEAAPPGWSNDGLINMFALSGEVLEGGYPLYFTGASGHEPLYHYLQAAVLALLGFNLLSGLLLSVILGTLGVLLSYILARRLLGPGTAATSSVLLAASFWSLMYSRIALRHVIVPTLSLVAIYWAWRLAAGPSDGLKPASSLWAAYGGWLGLAIVLAALWYSYPAGRLMPVLVAGFVGYLALFHRQRLAGRWRGALFSIGVAVLLVLPLQVAIAQGRADDPGSGIGADARLWQLAVPLRALKEGDFQPLLENVLGTLAMFYPQGDPEWLYNIAGRPVFGLLGGLLFWSGFLISVRRWREPRHFLLLLWLACGLLPTFVSVPPGSLSHTVLAQPAVYILLGVGLVELGHLVKRLFRWLARSGPGRLPRFASMLVVVLLVLFLSYRDLFDYYAVWPERGMVQLLYHGEYREVARCIDGWTDRSNVAVSSSLQDPWDGLALELDMQRGDVAVRLFNPERALLWAAGDSRAVTILTGWPEPTPLLAEYLDEQHLKARLGEWSRVYELEALEEAQSKPLASFANNLVLLAADWVDGQAPGSGAEAVLRTSWIARARVDHPETTVVAYPPPPGVYFGPRLAVFAHLLAEDGTLVDGDDGLWVDPTRLLEGDRFVQFHQFSVEAWPSGEAPTLELGLYDPYTGERWSLLDSNGEPAGDRLTLDAGCMDW
jgi:hypothetical protein